MKTDMIQNNTETTLEATAADTGLRADKFVAQNFTTYSRSFLQKLFQDGKVTIHNSKPIKASYTIKDGDLITINFIQEKQTPSIKQTPSDLHIKIIAQNDDFLIIDKPAGLVVHPPHKNYETFALTDWITQTHEEIAHVGMIDRPGIVHRLDKETSGLMIIPRTNNAHGAITNMFKARKIQKTYLAIVLGHPEQSGSIDYFIGRHPTIKNKMHHFSSTTKRASSKDATTHYKVLQYFKDYSLVEIKPVTGRTHQIRVHFSALGFPLLADPVYGMKSKILKRHALHAHKLEFSYSGTDYSFVSPLPDDLANILNIIEPSESLPTQRQ